MNCFQIPNFRDDSQEIFEKFRFVGVVNCFQIPNFRDDSQGQFLGKGIGYGCELLSDS